MTLTATLNAAARRLPTWPIYALALLLPAWLVWQAQAGGLGADPLKVLEHRLGKTGLQLLVAGLMITPIKRLCGINLVRFRRALGVTAFFLVFEHLLVWLVLDVQIPAQIWADIVKRPYITIGMAGFILLIPLAVTSTNGMIRRLGPVRWRRLHRLVYLAVPLGAVHYAMLGKVWQPEALIYLAATLLLVAARLPLRPRRAAVQTAR